MNTHLMTIKELHPFVQCMMHLMATEGQQITIKYIEGRPGLKIDGWEPTAPHVPYVELHEREFEWLNNKHIVTIEQ